MSSLTAYNKQNDQPTLVGNWLEERALKDSTGFGRTGALTVTGESLTSNTSSHLTAVPTHPRVIEHVARLEPVDWRATSTISYMDPQAARKHLLTQYAGSKPQGPREREALTELLKAASILSGPEPGPLVYETTHQSTFIQHNLTGVSLGSRVMHDPDGGPVTRDPVFLVEAKIMSRTRADRGLMQGQATSSGALSTCRHPNSNMPITIYSESIAGGLGASTFYGTRRGGDRPFHRKDDFTKLMSDINKKDED